MERPVIFWGKKLISDFRESVPGRSLHGTLFGTLFRDAFPGRSVGLFRGNSRFSRKNAENRRFSEIFTEKIGFTWVFAEKVRKKSLFSVKKLLFSSKEKKNYRFFEKRPESVPGRSLRGKHAKSVKDALSMGRSPGRSLAELR